MRVPALLLCAASILATSKGAHANGRFPAAQHVLIGPGSSSSTIVLRTTFGLLVSDDSAKTFHYICEEPLGYAGAAFDPAIALDAEGRVAVGLFNGLSRVDRSRCDYPHAPALAGEYVTDLDDGGDGKIILAVTATGFVERRNGAYRSDDSGATYRKLGDGLLAVQFDTVERAPSNPNRIYATATRLSPRTSLLLRSDDGGATWTEKPIDIPNTIGAYISGVHKTNADIVFVRAVVDEPVDGGTSRRRTVLARSDDALASLRELARAQGQMLGFAFEPDGKTLWYGGPDPLDGLQRSTDSGDTWTKIASTQVRCLRAHEGVLWVCGTEAADGFSLARSADRGTTLEPVVHFASVAGPVSCGADSAADVCAERWSALKPLFPAVDAGPPPTDAGPTPTDAGVVDATIDVAPPDATAPSGEARADGFGCAAASPRPSSALASISLLAIAIYWRRRRISGN